MINVKAILAAVVEYLSENPGAATIVGGFAVLALAKLGLHVTEAQLYGIVAVLLPLIAGGHLLARRARYKIQSRRLRVAIAAGAPVVLPHAPAAAAPAEPKFEVPDSPEGIEDK